MNLGRLAPPDMDAACEKKTAPTRGRPYESIAALFHSIGRQFDGGVVCAPGVTIGQARSTLFSGSIGGLLSHSRVLLRPSATGARSGHHQRVSAGDSRLFDSCVA